MRPLFTNALPATAENLNHAKTWVQALRAGGGTEMAPALTFALNGRETPGYLRQVIFMTDGGVTNEEELFRLIASRLGNSRLFTVGIGSAPHPPPLPPPPAPRRRPLPHTRGVTQVH